jgi:hypothetical protein
MTTYSPTRFNINTGLDERGYDMSLLRMPTETLYDYRKRLLLETREPAGPTQDDYIRVVNRTTGLFETKLLEIDLVLDGNDEPLASDPFVEVTSSFLRVYSDYTNGVMDLELDIHKKGTYRFVGDVITQLQTLANFSVTILASNYAYLASSHLRYGNTTRTANLPIPHRRYVTSFSQGNIESIRASDPWVFKNEVASVAAITEDGDFYVDYTNGVVWSHLLQRGRIFYTYREFPYTLVWQPIRAFPYNDDDSDYLYKQDLIDDATGVAVPNMLNDDGARIANIVLAAHPLVWGE